jgi:hypothetical protein
MGYEKYLYRNNKYGKVKKGGLMRMKQTLIVNKKENLRFPCKISSRSQVIKVMKIITQAMIPGLWVITVRYQHKQNLHISWLLWVTLLASNLHKRKGYLVQNKLPCINRGAYMIKTNQELTFHTFRTGLTLLFQLQLSLHLYS